MKKTTCALALVAALFAAGCCSCTPTPPTPPPAATTTREVASIQIVFTSAPDASLVAKLQAVGAKPDASGLVWTLANWDFRNPQQEAAIEAALRVGATLKKGGS